VHPDIELPPGIALSEDCAVAAYQIIRELLNNVVLHARAENVWVRARIADDKLQLTVRDDGIGFDPNLADRAPQALVYAYRHATTNDFFIAGDSGAGYLNPRALTVRPDSTLPSGLGVWTEHCRKYYNRWGMTITGFMLDGAGGESTDLEFRAYHSFSPDGAGRHFERAPALHAGLPTCREQDLPDDVAQAARAIAELAKQPRSGPQFLWARSILKPPKWYADRSQAVAQACPDQAVCFVHPYSFFGLIRLHCSGN
jgi:hypothetical protein